MKLTNRIAQIFLYSLCFSHAIFGQNQYKGTSTTINFFSETPLENIDAKSTEAKSVLSIPKNQIAFSIPIKSFEFKNALMQEHFNEKYMESDKFPTSTFSGSIKDDVDLTKDGEYEVKVDGKLKIHGVEKQITAPAKATVKNGIVSLQSLFMVKLVDYNIEVPTIVFNKIAEEIKIIVSANFNVR